MKTLGNIVVAALALVMVVHTGASGGDDLSSGGTESGLIHFKSTPLTYQAKLTEELANPECADLFHWAKALCEREECKRAHGIFQPQGELMSNGANGE